MPLTGDKNEFEEAEIIEIISSENPSEKLKEIENTKKEQIKISKEKELELLIKQRTKKLHLREKLNKEILDLEDEIENLKKDCL